MVCEAAVFIVRQFEGISVSDLLDSEKSFYEAITNPLQLRWLPPNAGLPLMAAGLIVNTLIDAASKACGLSAWEYLARLPIEFLLDLLQQRHLGRRYNRHELKRILDHLPIYRRSQIYGRQDIDLSDSTLGDWVGGVPTLLAPLLEALHQHVFAATKIHTDDTPIKVLASGAGKSRLKAQVRGKPPNKRKQTRQEKSKPKVLAFHQWLLDQLPTLSKKSVAADAIRYALNQWQALTRFLDNGAIEIDNNTTERALRSVSIGRKNFLFLGSNAGSDRAATLYSLLGTAKLNGMNPEKYLTHVLSVIADHNVNKVDELLPWKVKL